MNIETYISNILYDYYKIKVKNKEDSVFSVEYGLKNRDIFIVIFSVCKYYDIDYLYLKRWNLGNVTFANLIKYFNILAGNSNGEEND